MEETAENILKVTGTRFSIFVNQLVFEILFSWKNFVPDLANK
jgi:hypothetical protein